MDTVPTTCEVVIVGAGISGASAAYHLALAGVAGIIVLETGTAGDGVLSPSVAPAHARFEKDHVFPFAQRSGSAVMPSAPCIKMMVRLYASSSQEFIHHHGMEGAKRYLRLSAQGIQFEKELGQLVLPNPDVQLRSVGSLYVAAEHDVGDLLQEFFTLQELGCKDIEWWDHDRLQHTGGCAGQFFCAIYFPGDAIIDSSTYAAALLYAAMETGRVTLYEGCSPVAKVITLTTEGDSSALTELQNGSRIASKHIVLATGGLFAEPSLAGILRPCWSYLVRLPHPTLLESGGLTGRSDEDDDEIPILPDGTPLNSHNFFTWGFTHDWCWTDGAVRVSGEDHYSALKPPRSAERCRSLASWVERAYPKVFPQAPKTEKALPASPTQPELPDAAHEYESQYGVYSETPDSVPLIGSAYPGSAVCYLLGCNAWGQAVMSYSSTLVPGLLGYIPLTDEQRDSMRLLSVRRFALLPAVQNKNRPV
ncbi:FAD dependent oxidoreductase [Ochromonadaceae sp. CCMP2298]|nr:FAD dependent oxidoreductase [Ochromonadaceae sp. CCMP2298]